jgi:hypothetical protein
MISLKWDKLYSNCLWTVVLHSYLVYQIGEDTYWYFTSKFHGFCSICRDLYGFCFIFRLSIYKFSINKETGNNNFYTFLELHNIGSCRKTYYQYVITNNELKWKIYKHKNILCKTNTENKNMKERPRTKYNSTGALRTKTICT